MDWIVGPVNYVFGMFDLVDMAVIFLIVVSASIYYFKTRSSPPKFNTSITSSSTPTLNGSTARADRSLLGRMKSDDRQVLILFGSQTGTAEELAGRLSKDLARYGKKPLVMDPEEIDVEDLQKLTELTDPLFLLFVATYGEGDPTDNAQELYEYFSKEDNGIDLTGLNYAVFGLGNKTYEHFNAVGKFLDKRLEELHATRIFELGLADDDGNLEEDFMRWRELFLPSISQHFGWELVNNGRIDRQYRLEIVSAPNGPIFDGEFGRVGAYAKQRPPFDQKNPYLSKIVVNRELHQGKSDRSCRHIELSIDSARMRYEAGDHVAVFPTNDSELVEKLGRLLNTDLDIVIKLINVDEDCMKKHPFPCPCKYRTALTHYVDICSPVKSHVLKALVEYTDDQSAKEYLTLLSTASDEGLREYASFVVRERRNIVDVLEHFGTCKPPLDLLLEMLPRLQPRYYSISSSPKQDNSRVAITAVVLRYTIGERLVKGVCTNYLASLQEEYSVPIFTRKSTLRLPNRMHIPVIMIGPGTGLAPFRGFLHERLWHKQQGKEIAEMHLYFGCRHPEHDHIYKEEMEEFVRCGVLTQLHVAYSRVSDQKVYVQHKLWENRDVIWSLIERGGAVYVCGDARNMARDVQNVFYKIFMEVGNLDQEASQKLMKDMERQRLYQADVWS